MEKLQSLDDVILVTHMGCMDGAACAIFFRRAGGKKENIRFVAAGMVERFIKEEPLINSDKWMIFADVGVNLPKYADLLEKRGHVILLDHHKTSLHLKGRDWCEIDAEGNGGSMCGCLVLLRYLLQCGPAVASRVADHGLLDFGRMVDDHDRWLRQDPRSEELATLMVFTGQERFIEMFMDAAERCTACVADSRCTFFNQWEYSLLRILDERRDESIAKAIKKAIVRQLFYGDGKGNDLVCNVAYVISTEPNVSLLLERLLEAHPECGVAAQINLDKETVSLRSHGRVDVSVIAKFFRGGGHQNASGHPLASNFAYFIVREVHNG